MKAECQTQLFELQALGRREVVAEFSGGTITSDAGGVLLREVEARTGLLAKFATCFDDHRDPDKVEHPVLDLLKQRAFRLCLAYKDLNDHETLRRTIRCMGINWDGSSTGTTTSTASCYCTSSVGCFRCARNCARGPTCGRCPENRLKEQQLSPVADRTSCVTMRANQLRLWFSTLTYLLRAVLREQGLKGIELATAHCDTLRTKLLKVGAVVTITFRKVWLRLSSACPFQTLFERVLTNLRNWRSPQSLAREVNMT